MKGLVILLVVYPLMAQIGSTRLGAVDSANVSSTAATHFCRQRPYTAPFSGGGAVKMGGK
jgi:hypothetical protein